MNADESVDKTLTTEGDMDYLKIAREALETKPRRTRIEAPFDHKLNLWNDRIPLPTKEAAIYVTDTLELAWSAALQIFGDDKATPQIAIERFQDEAICAG